MPLAMASAAAAGTVALLREQLLERGPLDVLEHEERPPRRRARDVEEEHDVRMREVAEDLRLAIELLAERRGRRDLGLQRLQGDDAPERLLHRLVDRGDRTRAQRLDDAIVAEADLAHRTSERDGPVIAAGWGRPMISSIVGATSQMRPPVRSFALAIGVVHVEERHRVQRVRGVRRAGLGVDHLLAVAVVGGDDERAALLANGLRDATDAHVDGLDGLDRRGRGRRCDRPCRGSRS